MIERRIDQHFSGGNLVVDLGCGDGSWIDSICSRYTRAIGFDINREQLASRPLPPESWEFIQADLNAGIPLPDDCADAVHANQVVEHIANPLRLFAETVRVLRPGGVFIATTPNIRYVRHISRLVFGGTGPVTSSGRVTNSEVWDDGHIHFFTARDLERIAHAAGFHQVGTEALISPSGRATVLRRALARLGSRGLVKGFLTGNVMLIAWK